jgi:hypothetical protein
MRVPASAIVFFFSIKYFVLAFLWHLFETALIRFLYYKYYGIIGLLPFLLALLVQIVEH